MLAQKIDGKQCALEIKEDLRQLCASYREQGFRAPKLLAVLVGEDGASKTYVESKIRSCREIGMESDTIILPEATSEKELLEQIEQINTDPNVDGFIVQLPLPAHIDPLKVKQAVDPSKDVDGFHPTNVGKMVMELPSFISATPFGVRELLIRNQIETSGKHCLIIGRSDIVGTPMSILMSRKALGANATVTLAHSRTKNLKELALEADILIVAIGQPEFVTGDMIRDGAIVIDVGIHRISDTSRKRGFRLVGDTKLREIKEKASLYTPVPGGVGPMTIAALMHNTMKAFAWAHNIPFKED